MAYSFRDSRVGYCQVSIKFRLSIGVDVMPPGRAPDLLFGSNEGFLGCALSCVRAL